MRLERAIGWLCLVLLIGGCSGRGRGRGGAAAPGPADASARPDASAVPMPPVARGGRVVTFADGKTPAREIHVSPAGNDANDGSKAHPIANVRAAVAKATPGTAVVLHPGRYEYIWLEDVFGSADAPIWIGGAAGEARPVFDDPRGGIHLSKARHVVIHDLEVTGNPVNGINIDDDGQYDDQDRTRWIVLRNLYIHHIGDGGNQDCLKLSGVNDFFVLDSQFSHCGGGGSGIDLVGCHRGVIADSRFSDMNDSGVQIKGGSEDILVLANRLEHAGARVLNLGGSTSYEYFRPRLSEQQPNFEARRILVIGNEVIGGIAPVAFVGCVDCLVANNTIVDPDRYALRILQETTSGPDYRFLPAARGRFVNNIVYYSSSTMHEHCNVGPDTAPETFTIASNLWFAHDEVGRSAPRLPVKERAAVIGQDPGLRGAPADLRVCAAGSPAAGPGVAVPEVIATGRFNEPLPIGAHAVGDCK